MGNPYLLLGKMASDEKVTSCDRAVKRRATICINYSILFVRNTNQIVCILLVEIYKIFHKFMFLQINTTTHCPQNIMYYNLNWCDRVEHLHTTMIQLYVPAPAHHHNQ